MQHQKKRGKIFVKQFFRIKTHFFAIRGCFSQMFVLQKKILFARGLNWDQSCLWKTPPSHFLLFSPLACPYFFNFFSSPDFWGVKEAPCKNLYVFGENWQRNQFPKLTTFLLHFSLMSPLCHSAMRTAVKDTAWMLVNKLQDEVEKLVNCGKTHSEYVCDRTLDVWHILAAPSKLCTKCCTLCLSCQSGM